jgi:hypothetical protein
MTDAKTTRELVYETNRDVKWICETRRAAGCDGPKDRSLSTVRWERSSSTGGAKVRVAT